MSFANAPKYYHTKATEIMKEDTSSSKLKNIKDCYNELEKDYIMFNMRSYDEIFVSKFRTKIFTTLQKFGIEIRDLSCFHSPYTPHIEREKAYVRDAIAQLLVAKENAQKECET